MRGPSPLPGDRSPPDTDELDAVRARVQLERAQLEPVGGLRELVAGRAGMPSVDPHLHLAPERAAQPELVAPRLRQPRRWPRTTPGPTVWTSEGSSVRRAQPAGSGSSAVGSSGQSARAALEAAPARPCSTARPDLVVAPAPLAPVLGRRCGSERRPPHDENREALDVLQAQLGQLDRIAEPRRRAVAGDRRQPRHGEAPPRHPPDRSRAGSASRTPRTRCRAPARVPPSAPPTVSSSASRSRGARLTSW